MQRHFRPFQKREGVWIPRTPSPVVARLISCISYVPLQPICCLPSRWLPSSLWVCLAISSFCIPCTFSSLWLVASLLFWDSGLGSSTVLLWWFLWLAACLLSCRASKVWKVSQSKQNTVPHIVFSPSFFTRNMFTTIANMKYFIASNKYISCLYFRVYFIASLTGFDKLFLADLPKRQPTERNWKTPLRMRSVWLLRRRHCCKMPELP